MAGAENLKSSNSNSNSNSKRRSSSAGSGLRKSSTKRRKAVAMRHFDVDSEDERLKQRLNAKFSVKHKKISDDAQGCYLQRGSDGTFCVHNGERHDTIIRRAEDARINRANKPSERNDCVPTRWKCALCQQRSSRSILGDLFGPYYVRILGKYWPSFLAKKPSHLNGEAEFVFDLWLHGMCALTAPDIQMWDNQLPALERKVVSFWKQHCAVCSKEGATIEMKGKLMHFPCAVMKGYKPDVPMEQMSSESDDN